MVLREEEKYVKYINSKQILLRNSPDTNSTIKYNVQANHGLQPVQKSMKRNMVTICISELGSESSHEVSLNFKQWLPSNSAVKNGAIIYHVWLDQWLQLLQKSLNRNMLTICTSPLGSESIHEVSLNSKQLLLRNNVDKKLSYILPCGTGSGATTHDKIIEPEHADDMHISTW